MDGWSAMGETASWPAVATATVLAAVFALVGTAVTTAWTVIRWRRDAERSRDTDDWDRVRWMVDLCCSGDTCRTEIGRRAADAMYEVLVTGPARDRTVTMVLEVLEERGSDGVRG